jgi:hypothetical protein
MISIKINEFLFGNIIFIVSDNELSLSTAIGYRGKKFLKCTVTKIPQRSFAKGSGKRTENQK